MSGDRAATLGVVHGAAELALFITTKNLAAKKFQAGDVFDSLMLLPFVTTATAVPDTLPTETHKRGSLSMLLN